MSCRILRDPGIRGAVVQVGGSGGEAFAVGGGAEAVVGLEAAGEVVLVCPAGSASGGPAGTRPCRSRSWSRRHGRADIGWKEAALMTDWASLTYMVVDVEGNGQQPPDLVELAIVPIRSGVIGEPASWLVKPDQPIKYFAAQIHGLSSGLCSRSHHRRRGGWLVRVSVGRRCRRPVRRDGLEDGLRFGVREVEVGGLGDFSFGI